MGERKRIGDLGVRQVMGSAEDCGGVSVEGINEWDSDWD